MGFKDGTANIKLEDAKALADHVWVGNRADEPAWLRGGSYLVARRIRMLIEVWDRAALGDQEQTIGRTKVIGAPLGGTDEFQTLKPKTLPVDSHVRLAHPDTNGGAKILRRGYSFTDGLESLGELDAGLFFLAYMRDPEAFITLQNRLGSHDALNEYIKHVGSGLWAVPPGRQARRLRRRQAHLTWCARRVLSPGSSWLAVTGERRRAPAGADRQAPLGAVRRGEAALKTRRGA